MFNIKDYWENHKKRNKEKWGAKWLAFKAKQSPNVQEKLTKLEDIYTNYKKSFWSEVVETVVFVVVMVIIIRFFIFEIRYIPSASMHPTLIEGDRIVVERFSRFFTTPKRGDIMVFYPPSTKLSHKPIPVLLRLIGISLKDTDIAYIKRVIGVPGDTVEIKQELNGASYVYINGKKYKEDYIQSIYDYPQCEPKQTKYYFEQEMMKCGPFKIKENNYFMMGDNRGASYDSRYWGTVTRERFVGRATNIYWPLRRFKILHQLKNINIK